ncbi:MAG: transcription elongation factor GreA [Mogibacterium sp.]|nr:transcription elongation factor GreA [Mogibacterium sp.]
MPEVNEMTREGYEELKNELEYLITVKRKENAERLKEAISYGDISENAEYDAAKDEQAETERRVFEIEALLRTAKVVEAASDNVDEGTVQIGRTVRVQEVNRNIEVEYKLVGTRESDPLKGKISAASAVGQHLIGHKAGDVVEFQVPAGMAKYKILEVK